MGETLIVYGPGDIPAADALTVDQAVENPPAGSDSSTHVEYTDGNTATDLPAEHQPA